MPYAYAILTHGPKPKGDVAKHPAARQQLHNLLDVAQASGKPEAFIITHDYSRRFNCLNDLPILKERLEHAKEIGTKVIIDDFRRLTAHCANHNALGLFFELHEYKGHFRDLKTGRDIGDFSETQITFICSAEPPIKYVRVPTPRKAHTYDQRLDQTRNAKIASRIARSEAANSKAEEIAALRAELLDTESQITHRALADAANEQGLVTTRKGPWTAVSVSRALKRLEAKPKTLAERAKQRLR